jgi:hypothetical protein
MVTFPFREPAVYVVVPPEEVVDGLKEPDGADQLMFVLDAPDTVVDMVIVCSLNTLLRETVMAATDTV